MHMNNMTLSSPSLAGKGPARSARVRSAFTLIELLTVIAIIAILAAIIFPAFAAVRENARAATTLSNMHQVSVAMGQFQLDNHKYPDVLFGYVYRDQGASAGTPVAMDKALEKCEADYRSALNAGATGPALEKVDPKNYFPGLYPEYIKDASAFFDPNNPDTDKTHVATGADGTTPPDINVLCPSANAACTGKAAGTLVVAAATTADGAIFPHEFYTVDALDISPAVDGTKQNTLLKAGNGSFVFVPRYQSSWSTVQDSLNCDNSANSPMCFDTGTKDANGTEIIRNDYLRQLRWRNPPADTYVTSTTYHVPFSNKVLVLWDSGSAKKVDASSSWQATSKPAGDATTVAVNGSGASQANFWRITPDAH